MPRETHKKEDVEWVPLTVVPSESIAVSFRESLKKEGVQTFLEEGEASSAFRSRFGGAVPPFDMWTVYVSAADLERAKGLIDTGENVSS